jgi:hypothetical protein
MTELLKQSAKAFVKAEPMVLLQKVRLASENFWLFGAYKSNNQLFEHFIY